MVPTLMREKRRTLWMKTEITHTPLFFAGKVSPPLQHKTPITFQLLSLIIIFTTININIFALHYLKISRGLRRSRRWADETEWNYFQKELPDLFP